MPYDNKNRGSIWKNERKETDTHPDFTGTYTDANGAEHWVSAWKRKEGAASNAPALTFSLKPKDARRPAAPKPARNDDMGGDSIPF